MSRTKRLIAALGIAGLLAVGTVAAVSAQWPTTCVELNDIVEAHLGNHGNVGIYQKTFGDQAEQACQNDHRNDVRSVFAWAVGEAPRQTPPTESAPNPLANHPDFDRVRQTAIDRGASPAKATAIASGVIERGATALFLAGFDTGAEYGVVPVVVSGAGETVSEIVPLPQGQYIATITWSNNFTYYCCGIAPLGRNFFADLVTVGASGGRIIDLVNGNGGTGRAQETFWLYGDGLTNVYIEVDTAEDRAQWRVLFTKVA